MSENSETEEAIEESSSSWEADVVGDGGWLWGPVLEGLGGGGGGGGLGIHQGEEEETAEVID